VVVVASAQLLTTGGVALLDYLTGTDQAMIVVDAVQLGDPPGTIHCLSWDELPVNGNATISAHGIGLRETIEVGRLLYPEKLPSIVRLIGIDTAESVAPGEPVQCFAIEASSYTTERLEGERVRLQFDVERIDPYGRTLAYVWLGDELFNETLVREGYAFVTTFPPDVRYVERFRAVWGQTRIEAPRGSVSFDEQFEPRILQAVASGRPTMLFAADADWRAPAAGDATPVGDGARPSMATRSWLIESRSRTVTALSSSVSKSIVTQYGVPTSS